MPLLYLLLGISGILFILALKTNPISAIITETVQDNITSKLKPVPYEELFKNIGSNIGVEWELLAAHAFAESSYNPKAYNPEGHKYSKAGSYGLMQILVEVDQYGIISNRLNVDDWYRVKLPEDLFEPELNIKIGAEIIKENIDRFHMPRAIAVYNRYAERKSPQFGPFKNQEYVDRVMRKYNQLKGT